MISNDLVVNDIQEHSLREELRKRIISLHLDFDQSIDNDMVQHIVNRLYHGLQTRFSGFLWGEVLYAFEQGVLGVWGSYGKIDVKTLMRWLQCVNTESSDVRRLGIQRQDKKYKNDEMQRSKYNALFGDAVAMRVDNPQLRNRKKYPLKLLVESIRRGETVEQIVKKNG